MNSSSVQQVSVQGLSLSAPRGLVFAQVPLVSLTDCEVVDCLAADACFNGSSATAFTASNSTFRNTLPPATQQSRGLSGAFFGETPFLSYQIQNCSFLNWYAAGAPILSLSAAQPPVTLVVLNSTFTNCSSD